jgi:hypothetical protein
MPQPVGLLQQPLPFSCHLPAISKSVGGLLWLPAHTVTGSPRLPVGRHLRNPLGLCLPAAWPGPRPPVPVANFVKPRFVVGTVVQVSSPFVLAPGGPQGPMTSIARPAGHPPGRGIRSPPAVTRGMVGCPFAPGGPYVLATLAQLANTMQSCASWSCWI